MFPIFNVLLYLKERKVNGKGHFQNITERQGRTVQVDTEESLYKSVVEPCLCYYYPMVFWCGLDILTTSLQEA